MMAKLSNKPSDGELAILQILWDKPNLSVREVHDILEGKRDIGYTTTLKQMQRMLEKGMLKRDIANKSHRYLALLDEAKTKRDIFSGISKTLFQGSAMQMVMNALDHTKTSAEELKQLKEWIKKQEENG
jgi:predicted transcriptional regulator